MKARKPKLIEWDGDVATFQEQVPHGENYDMDWPGEFEARITHKNVYWAVTIFPGQPFEIKFKEYLVQRLYVTNQVKRILQAYLQGYYDGNG